MNRRVWTGIVAGVLAAFLLLGVGVASFQAGRDDEVVARTVGDGEVVRVIERGHGWGFFPGRILFPLLLVLVVVLLLRGRHHSWHGGSGYGHGYGPPGYARSGWGPGPGGGPGPGCGTREEHMEEWHRRMHGEPASPGAPTTTAAAGTVAERSPGIGGPPTDPDPTDPSGYPGTGSTPIDPSEPPGAGSPSPTA